MRSLVAMAVASLLIVGASAASEADASVKRFTNIEAQGLEPALKSLAREREFQVVYRSEVVGERKTRGIEGELTAEEALRGLLEGTGLTYRYLDEKTVMIMREGAAARSGVENWREDGVRMAQNEASTSNPSPSSRGEDVGAKDEDGSKKDALQEIVVTATKREERLQDVPISISVVTSEEIDRKGLLSAGDYLRGMPGVNQTDEGDVQSITIRGIETNPSVQNFSSGTTTAVYFGETPLNYSGTLLGNTATDLKLVDIERVEVLRGPQGIAFGSASLGGAVRTIPVAPKLGHFEGKALMGYSLTSGTGSDNYHLQGVANVPLIQDKLAIRAVGFHYENSGIYRNVAGSDPNFQAEAAQYGVQAFAVDSDNVGASNYTGGRVAAVFQASDALQFTLSYLEQKTQFDGGAFAETGKYEQKQLGAAPEHVMRGEKLSAYDSETELVNGTMSYDLTWANLLATYSYAKSSRETSNSGGTVSFPVSSNQFAEHGGGIAEVRLATQLKGAWDFLVGLYAEDLDDDYTTGELVWFGSPSSNPFGPDPNLGVYDEERNLKQKAAFGQVSWEFVPGFTLTGGARFYDYERTGEIVTGGILFGERITDTGTEKSGASYRATLSYKPSDDSLLYAGWSQGFRLGKPQVGLPTTCDTDNDGFVDHQPHITMESTRSLDSDEVDNYELGSKFALLDGRLGISTAVYRMDWSGLPVVVAPGGCIATYNTNAGAARSEGLEFEANLQITDAIRADFGGSWIDAKLTEDVPGQGFSDGDRLPNTPKVNANLGLQYEFAISGYKAFVRADSIYVGPFYGDISQTPNTKAGDYVQLDARARVTIKNLNIDLFVDNLTNEDAFTFRGATDSGLSFFGYRPRPRTTGIQLGYNF